MKRSSLGIWSISFLVSSLLATNVFAYGTGISSYPLPAKTQALSVEVTNVMSNGSGTGFQGRYSNKLNEKLLVDGGVGFSTGQRSRRAFAAADYEIFPDYKSQPKVSARPFIEAANEYDSRRTILGAAPVVSKGFSVSDKELFGHISLPVGLNLNSANQQYQFVSNVAFGVSGQLPIEGYKNLIGHLEANINLKNSFSGFFTGVTYPFN